jgi:hypothetical protein
MKSLDSRRDIVILSCIPTSNSFVPKSELVDLDEKMRCDKSDTETKTRKSYTRFKLLENKVRYPPRISTGNTGNSRLIEQFGRRRVRLSSDGPPGMTLNQRVDSLEK